MGIEKNVDRTGNGMILPIGVVMVIAVLLIGFAGTENRRSYQVEHIDIKYCAAACTEYLIDKHHNTAHGFLASGSSSIGGDDTIGSINQICKDFVAGEQCGRIERGDLDNLDKFAERWGRVGILKQ